MLRPVTEAAMSNESEVVQALLLARYTLVIHDAMRVTSEGETWQLDFSSELAKIDAALQSVGVDTSQPMLAPVRWDR
jgi:hypothetical protein